jgi:hypothetical protein
MQEYSYTAQKKIREGHLNNFFQIKYLYPPCMQHIHTKKKPKKKKKHKKEGLHIYVFDQASKGNQKKGRRRNPIKHYLYTLPGLDFACLR